MWRLGQLAVTLVVVVANLFGICAVLAVTLFVVPFPDLGSHTDHVRVVSGIVGVAYGALAVPVGMVLGTRRLWQLRAWLAEERPATPAEQALVLTAPRRLFLLQVALWFGAAAAFWILDGIYSGALGWRVALTIAITGVTTASIAYLLAERMMRPAATRALANATAERLRGRGVATRAVLAWAAASGLPTLGLLAIGVFVLTDKTVGHAKVGIAIIVLTGTVLSIGLLAVSLAARATADPIDSVRKALAKVRGGDFDVRVPVYDATQVGQLQLGFNQMVEGLAEREAIREAFGTYVDPDVADHIMREGTSLEGEDVEVTIMFIDVRGFTSFAENRAAREVVAAINQMFAVIVPVIHEQGGRVDKFVGDGLMAVFGAPRRQPDHADRALRAALAVEQEMRAGRAGELLIGIGLNSGMVLAGNVGAPGRVEFGVIGDVVNVAARVEAATRQTGDTILLSGSTRALLRGSALELVERPAMPLKGKSASVDLYAPPLPDRAPGGPGKRGA